MERSITRFHLDTPYSSPNNWPEISTNDQDTTLELLCSLLSPIGSHRQNHITPSKGKRDKKRKRNNDTTEDQSKPPTPEIASQILVGFNSIIRHLQALSHVPEDAAPSVEEVDPKSPYIAAIFTTQPSSAQSILHSNFPLLAATASLSNPSHTPIRLVQLPKGCGNRLATALGLPRVNFVAVLEKAQGSSVLLEFVREKVAVLDDFGLKRGEAKYREVNIVGVEGSVGVGRRQRNLEKAKKGGQAAVTEKGKDTTKQPWKQQKQKK